VDVEWVMLADRAEILGNKLYVMGGGWDVVTVLGPLPAQHLCGIAASFLADWNNDTNRPHDVEVEVQSEDGVQIWAMRGQLEVGRPPGIRPGQRQRTQIAANLGLSLPTLGTYVVIARVGDEELARVQFNVVAGQTPAPPLG